MDRQKGAPRSKISASLKPFPLSHPFLQLVNPNLSHLLKIPDCITKSPNRSKYFNSSQSFVTCADLIHPKSQAPNLSQRPGRQIAATPIPNALPSIFPPCSECALTSPLDVLEIGVQVSSYTHRRLNTTNDLNFTSKARHARFTFASQTGLAKFSE